MKDKSTTLIDLHYLPSLEYFCTLLPFENIILESYEHFVKQTYRNRCYINTAHGKKILTVPLLERHEKVLAKDIKVEQGKQWRSNHWRSIESAYRKAPFFDFYSAELKNILYSDHKYLFNLNQDLLSFCLRQVGFKKNISASVSYEKQPSENIFDARNMVTDKKPFSIRNYYRPHPYYQVFGNEFVPNPSIVDLLFCVGPEASAWIKASAASLNK